MGMINYFTFDGVSSRDFGVFISGTTVFDAAPRSIQTVAVPGRSGTLTLDNGRFENVDLVYPAFIYDQFHENIEGLRNFLLSAAGYRRLEDTYNPNTYMMARYVSGLSVETTQIRKQGQFDLTFDRMPQRFLKAGEDPVEFTAAGSITNPTRFAAKPLIRVYGTGTLGIGSETITITQNPGYIDIDSEMMDAYYGATNCNGYITLSSGEFPVLEPGSNGVNPGTGITRVSITPRWWIL